MTLESYNLLDADEPPPTSISGTGGRSPFLLVCEHANRRLPRKLGDLGLNETDLRRHIAWDIGAAQVAKRLSDELDATLILQNYSRLVIDCNRSTDRPDAIPIISELTEIPGNQNLTSAEISARVEEVYEPFQRAVSDELDARRQSGRASILVAIHSFTPVFKGAVRPWHVGLLYNRDGRLGRSLFDVMQDDRDLTIGINEPYAISDETDFTIPVHGERRGILHIEFEIRQDLIEVEEGQQDWAKRLSRWLKDSLNDLAGSETLGIR